MLRLTLALFAGLAAVPALSQTPVTDDLTPTLAPDRYRICTDRPARPAWADALGVREAWKGLTLRALYELRAWQEIVARGDCSCATRFPDWSAADEEYRERYLTLSQREQTALRADLRAARPLIEDQVRAICTAEGNW